MIPQGFQEQVESTFRHRQYPGDLHIVDRWLGTPGHPSEAVWEFYRRKPWKAILELGRARDPRVTLEHLKVRGFVYYLPAFLLLSFEPGDPLGIREGMLERLRAVPEKVAHWLHPRGKRVVVLGLEHLAEAYEQRGMTPNTPAKALEEYWAYFTDEELWSCREVHEIEDLREEIEAAFSWRSYPGDDAIVNRRCGCIGWEAEEAWEVYRGMSWREALRRGEEIDHRQYLTWLTTQGFVYYLPAFLTLSLDPRLTNDFCPDTETVITLWTSPEEVSSLLTPVEKRTVVHVLEYLADAHEEREWPDVSVVHNDARKALLHYWAYFTDAELGLTKAETAGKSEELT